MQTQQTRISGLMAGYEAALTEYGLGYATRLRMLQRADVIVHRHEKRKAEYLSGEIISEYFREIDNRFYAGEIGKDHNMTLRREAERFIWFAQTGNMKLPNPSKGCRQNLTQEYEQIAEEYLSGDMHPNTRNDARWVTHKYFAWLAEQGCDDFRRVGAEQIQKFLLYCSSQMTMNSLYNIKIHLIKLYAYLYDAGLSESSYRALLSFKVNRESRIFSVLSRAEIARVLETIDRTTVKGKRSYAVMMLGTVLGLRACDVANLKLTDIDWITGEIKILQLKTSETAVLPLTQDVGEALQDYILNGRPKTNDKQIFIRLNAPHTAMKSAVSIGEIFEDCCKAAGLDYGKKFHTLRRSLGTSMVNAGTPVTTVAQVLGHNEIDSTKKYIAVDSERLKLCALPLDGIVPKGGRSR